MEQFFGPYPVFSVSFVFIAINSLIAIVEIVYESGINILSKGMIALELLFIANLILAIFVNLGLKSGRYIIAKKHSRQECYTPRIWEVLMVVTGNIGVSLYYIVRYYVNGVFPPYFLMLMFMASLMLGIVLWIHISCGRIQRKVH